MDCTTQSPDLCRAIAVAKPHAAGCDKGQCRAPLALSWAHPSHSESSAGRQGRAQPTLAGSRIVLLTRLTAKEKLEKAFLGICLDSLLFLKGCTAGSNCCLRGRELCYLCSLEQKSTTFGQFCVSCRAEITELLPLEPLCQGCFQAKSEFTARRAVLREGSCLGLTQTCYLLTKLLNVHE